MYKDRPESHQLAYSAVTSSAGSTQWETSGGKYRNDEFDGKYIQGNSKNTLKVDSNADLAFLRNTVGPSLITNNNLLTPNSDSKKVDTSLRQTMNITSNVKDLFKSSHQPTEKRTSRAETFNESRNIDKNNKNSPAENDRLERIMNKFDKKNETKEALKLLEELKELKRKQEELKKQRKPDTIKEIDQTKIDTSDLVINKEFQELKKTPISYDLNSPINFSKKNKVDYYTPTYGNKSESTYPHSPQEEMSYQRHKKASYDFTGQNIAINVNSQPYYKNSQREESTIQGLVPSNLSKSTSNLKPYYDIGGSTETSSKKSSFARLSVKDYLSSSTVADSKYEKDYRPGTSYKTSDEYARSNYEGLNVATSFQDNLQSKSPSVKYSSKEKSYSSKYSKYDSVSLSSTPLKDAFGGRKITINDFQLGKNLGEGKFGTVYQAFDKKTKTIYALKKIPKSVIKSHWMIDQFILEVKLQQFCNHPNILSLHGCFDDSEHVYILLEYMEEGTLFLHLKKNSTLGEKEAAMRVKEMASAIQYLHENGIAHRDLKPENIVMSHGVCKLCDFGWATICDERRKTYCGTFDYAAPEILEGEEYDMSVDLWCLGILAYEILVGKAPFYHISRKETMKKIMNCENEKINYPSSMSYEARSFIEQLLKRNPEERLKSEDLLKHPFILLADK